MRRLKQTDIGKVAPELIISNSVSDASVQEDKSNGSELMVMYSE
jgi:hypothetical protein